jgi:hypothetical protein
MEIASWTGEQPCTVTLYWHEYGGYTVVSGENSIKKYCSLPDNEL